MSEMYKKTNVVEEPKVEDVPLEGSDFPATDGENDVEGGLEGKTAAKSKVAKSRSSTKTTTNKAIAGGILYLLANQANAAQQAIGSYDCVGGITLSSASTVCVRDLNYENCTYNLDTLISLPFSHTSACFTLRNQDNSSVVGNLTINYDEEVQYNTLVTQYYTGPWTGFVSSNRDCWTTGNWCGNRCNDILATDPSVGGHVSDTNVNNYPGRSGCVRSCGCISCNCFYCDQACLTYRWALHGALPVYQVSLPVSSEYRVYISGSYGTDHFGSQLARSGDSFHLGNLSIQVVGSFPPPTVTISPKKIIQNGGLTFLTDACDRNVPCLGLPGDIQAGISANVTRADPNAFIFNTQIATLNIGDRSVGASFYRVGVTAAMQQLPTYYNGRVWELKNGFLTANETATNAILIRVQTNSPITLSRTLDIVCPKFSILSYAGCFTCSFGATVIIQARSTCLPGNALVYVPDTLNVSLSQNSLQLTADNQNFTIHFLASDRNVDFQLYLKANGGIENHNISMILLSSSELESMNDTLGHAAATSSGSGWDDFISSVGNFFSNILFGNWWSSLLSTIMIVIIACLIAYGCLMLYRFYKAKQTQKALKKEK